MFRAQISSVSGNLGRESRTPVDCRARSKASMPSANPFRRMAEIVRDNDELFRRADVASARLARAREYAADPYSDPDLSAVLVERARRKLSDVLGRLRANRTEGIELLRSVNEVDVPARTLSR